MASDRDLAGEQSMACLIQFPQALTSRERTGIRTVVKNFGHLSSAEIIEQLKAFAETLSFPISARVLRELDEQVELHRTQLIASWSADR